MFVLSLAWRDFLGDKLLWGLSASAVALGVAVVVSSDVVKAALLNALSASEDAQMIWAGMTDQLDSNLTAIGLAITLAAGFIVFNAFGISVARRRRRLATLRAVGMTKLQVLRLALTEAFLISLVGVVLGLAAGPFLGRLTITAITSVTPEGLLVFRPGPPNAAVMIRAALLGLGISTLAATVPAIQATRVSPMAARRPQEAGGIQRSRAWIGLITLGAMLVILLYLRIAPPGATLEPPWDIRVALLFTALWLALVLLITGVAAGVVGSWVRAPLQRLAGAGGILVADNLMRARRRVTLTVVALTMALALVVGLTGFTNFTFEFLMRPIIDRAAGLGAWIVTGFDPLQGMSAYQDMERITLLDQDIDTVRALTGDRADVTKFRYSPVPELSFFGDRFFSYVLEPQELTRASEWLFEFDQGDWESAREAMEEGCGVLVMPSVASEINASFGDVVEVTGASEIVKCKVAGIGSSFMTGSVIGTTDTSKFDATETVALLVIPLPGTDRLALESDLQSLTPALTITVMDDIAVASNALVEQIPLVFDGMAVLAVLAAGLGVVNTLTAGVVERRGEFGLFRAVGATRRQLRGVVTGEAALMVGLGAALGIVAGMGLAIIIPTVYGGNGWGIRDLDHWAAAIDAIKAALPIGLFGWLVAVMIGGLAGLLTARGMMRRRRFVDELQAERH
ncbi:MAG: FtsX-like permease family protein [Anaerolineales bacterium]